MKAYHSFAAVRDALKSGESNCKKIVQSYLDNIEKASDLNAFLEVFASDALTRAEEVDHKISQGNAGRLAGMVIAIKDNICYKGHRVSAASKILEEHTSLYNSTVVERLLREDAVIIGRLNCDEFAMGSSNENSAYGPVLNPHDHTKVSGGSSGGATAAVAAGLCLAAFGSDTGGSIRQPASFCGGVGVKPTYGRVSRYGLLAFASSFDQIGPITNNVEDAALLLEVIAGKDEYDSTLSRKEVPAYSDLLNFKGKARIAYIREAVENDGLDPEIRQFMEGLIEKLRSEGHTVEPISFPYLDYMVPAYYVLTTAEASSNLSRYDGIHYGYRSEASEDVYSTYTRSRTEGFGKEVKRRIMLGTFVLSAGYYDAYYSKGQKVRRIIRDKTLDALESYQYILLPTTPHTAFTIGKNTNDPVAMYLEDIFTVQANLCGIPAASLPIGQHSNGLPFGIQVMSNRFDEAGLFAFSKYLMTVS